MTMLLFVLVYWVRVFFAFEQKVIARESLYHMASIAIRYGVRIASLPMPGAPFDDVPPLVVVQSGACPLLYCVLRAART